MTTHTRGPWTAIISPASKRTPHSAMVSTGHHPSLAIEATNSGADQAEDAANALLIAAAPDLLEALRTVTILYGDLFAADAKSMARAAIAKAGIAP